MTAPIDSRFSLFQDGGNLIPGDTVVGLRAGINTKFNNTGGVGVFLPLLGGTMLGAIDMGGFNITNLATPVNPADAVTKTYADLMLPLAGGTMSGIINMGSHKITSLTDPTNPQDAATKAYVDSTGSGTVSPGLINQLAWYAAGGSTVSGLTIANSASLVTNGSGVPAWQTLTAGQILIGTTSGAPAAAAINSGTGILVGNASGSITVNLAAIADHTLLANISGGALAPSSTTLTALIDNALGSTQGDILYRNGSVWTVLAPGSSGQIFMTGGAAANPAWTTPTYPGASGAVGKILRSDGTNNVYSTATYPDLAGTSGNVLTSDGTNWISSAPATSGTVTSIATNNGVTGGTITSTGTIGLAAIADHTLLANISGGSLFPSSTTLTALIDNAIGSTQGDILYRNGTVWTVLAPSTSGLPLLTQGAAANPKFDVLQVPGGGTGVATWTAFSLVAASNTSTGNLVSLSSTGSGAGTTGQMLQSAGSAAYPTWSTATFPATATSAGTILRANGTNWIASTATFADTYGASTLLYSNGANTVTGLATANSGVLVTSVSGVPSISSTLPAFTTSSITFSPTTGGIVGTTTNDNAGSGKVGEFVSSVIPNASPVTITAGNTPQDMTSISLTAGDWDVYGNAYFLCPGVTGAAAYCWISTTSATFPDNSLVNGYSESVSPNIGIIAISAPYIRISISTTTTVYISVYFNFGASSCTARGGIYARRAR